MVESRGPESPFLTPQMVLKYQMSVITLAQKRPKTNQKHI